MAEKITKSLTVRLTSKAKVFASSYSVAKIAMAAVLLSCSGNKYLKDADIEASFAERSYFSPEQVTAGNESNFAPSLSPNGAYVLYTSDRDGNKDIWEKKTFGGFARPITRHPADDFGQSISPDGDKIAFISRRDDAAGDIHVGDIEASSFDGLLGASEPDFSVVSSKGTEDTNPSWFPNSEKIVFAARAPGDKYPAIMMADISDLKPVPVGDARGDQPSVSPDGEKIVYVRDGAIYLYQQDGAKTTQLTEGGAVQDGQPRFTPDGESLLFIRYADDTNRDGKLDGDDKPSIWRYNFPKNAATSMPLENYTLTPLTSSEFSAYQPQLRPPYLYVGLQTSEGLNIFRLPDFGQIKPAPDIESLRQTLDRTPEFERKVLLLRRTQVAMYAAGQSEQAAEAALIELDLQVLAGRPAEALWVGKKLIKNFSGAYPALAELQLILLDLSPLAYPRYKDELTVEQEKSLDELEKRADAVLKTFQADSSSNGRRVAGHARFVKANILASKRKLFVAQEVLGKLKEQNKDNPDLSAKIDLYAAILTPATADRDTALRAFMRVVNDYKNNRAIVRLASQNAVDLVMQKEPYVESLVQLRLDAKDLPVMPALAHMQIAKHYESVKKDAVAANELRQIVDSYPQSPEIVLEAAELLSRFEERADRYDAAEAMLVRLNEAFKSQSNDNKNAAKNLYIEFLIRRGEAYLRAKNPTAALAEYNKALGIEAYNISAHRGRIDASYQLQTWRDLIPEYENLLSDNPNSAELTYILAYALTYEIDDASSIGGKISAIEDAIDLVLEARSMNSQILQAHQTLGWLDIQLAYWQKRRLESGSVLAKLQRRWDIVLATFGSRDPNWLLVGIDSFETAFFLTKENSMDRAILAQNLGQAYYELGNFQKSLQYYMKRIKVLSYLRMRDAQSEGFLWRRAGRAAFQTDELELATVLQRKALQVFESLADDEQIAYSVDALALTLRERGLHKEAIPLLERLVDINQRLGKTRNVLTTTMSLAYCMYLDNQLDTSLENFEKADQLLAQLHTAIGNGEAEDWEVDADGAIRVPMPDGTEGPKGFSTTMRQAIVLAFKAKIHEKQGRIDLAIDALSRRLQVLDAERERRDDVGGWSDKSLVEEISITRNSLAGLELIGGEHLKAKEHFAQALAASKSLRSEAQAYMNDAELINRINIARVDLRLASIGLMKSEEQERQATDLANEAGALRPVYLEGARQAGKPLSQLLSLAASFRNPKSNPSNSELAQKELKEAISIIQQIEPYPGRENGPMLASLGSSIGPKEQELAQLEKKFIDSERANLELEWKILAAEAQWQKAFLSLEKLIESGSVLRSPADRRLARRIFENTLGQGNTEVDQPHLVFRRYLRLRHMELALRSLGEPKTAPAAGTSPVPVIPTGGAKPSPSSKHMASTKASFRLANSIERLLAIKSDEDIKKRLKPGESVLSFHRGLDGRLWLFAMNQQGVSQTRIAAAGKDIDDPSPIMAALNSTEVAAQLPTPKSRLFIVPSAELFDVAWELVRIGNEPLSTRNEISFIASPDHLPDLAQRMSLPKQTIGHIAWPNAAPLSTEGDTLETPKPLAPDHDGNSRVKTLMAANKARYYTRLSPSGDASIGRRFPQFDIVQLDAPLFLNDVEPGKSVIKGVNRPRAIDHVNDLSLKQLAAMELPATTGMLFTNVIKAGQDLKASGEGSDGWVLLSIAAASAGVPTVLYLENKGDVEGPANLAVVESQEGNDAKGNDQEVNNPKAKSGSDGSDEDSSKETDLETANKSKTAEGDKDSENEEKSEEAQGQEGQDGSEKTPVVAEEQDTEETAPYVNLAAYSVDWKAFYDSLSHASIGEAKHKTGIPGRILGVGGIPGAEEKAYAEANLEDALDEGADLADAQNFMSAAGVFKKALYLAKIKGDESAIDTALKNIVQSYSKKREFESALAFRLTMVERLRPKQAGEKPADPLELAKGLVESAVLSTLANRHEEAASYLDEAEALAKSEDEPELLGKIWHSRGVSLDNQKRYEDAIKAYEKSREYYQDENAGLAAARLLDIANVYASKLNDYPKAISYYEQAASAFKAKGDKPAYINVMIDKAQSLYVLGQLSEAINILENIAIPALDRQKQRVAWIRASQKLANTYYRAGMYQDAKGLSDKILEEVEEIDADGTRIPLSLDAIALSGMILAKQGKYEESFALFRDGIKQAKARKLDINLAILYNNLGFWQREAGEIDASIEHLNLALKIDQKAKSRRDIAYDQRNLGFSVMLKGDLNRAREYLNQALKTSEQLHLSHNLAYCRFGLGDLARREKKWPEAEDQFTKALAVTEKGYMLDFVWRARAGLGEALLAQGKVEEAFSQYRSATGLIENLRAGLKSEGSKSDFYSEAGVQEVYEAYASILMRLKKVEEAWVASEKSRSRAFMDALGTQKLKFAKAGAQSLLAEEKTLKDNVESLEMRLAALDKGSDQRKPLESSLQKARTLYTAHLAKIRAQNQQVAQFVNVERIGKDELAKLLPVDTALLQYLVTEDQLHIWVVRNGTITGNSVNIAAKDLEARVRDFRTLMQNFSATDYLGRELSDILLKPVASALTGVKRIAIVPHRQLHFLPFAALPHETGYLIDRYAVYYLDSATVARYTHSGKPTKTNANLSILAYANPETKQPGRPDLPFAEREVEAMGRYFSGITRRVGAEADKDRLLNESQEFDVLHIASHGEFKPDEPAESRLLLASAGGKNGALTVSDVFAMPLKAKLVTLSACESGLGRLSSGDEVIGMHRAFFFAGAETVVTTLWRISDVASAVAMKRFYRYLAEGHDKAEALSLSQKTVRRYFQHPAYWSGFRVLGNYQ